MGHYNLIKLNATSSTNDKVKTLIKSGKIGSGDITYLDFLEYVGKTQKPILLATGASSMKEVETAVKTIKSTGNNKIILMHSVTQYPSPIQEANLKAITTLMKKFSVCYYPC